MIFSPALVPAWVRETLGWPTGRGVRVGVIGSGYDNDVPDARVVQGVSFVDPEDDLEQLRTIDDHDRMGQGTTCARLVLRMAPHAQVVPIRIFGEDAESSPGTLHSGLAWAVEQALDVVCVAAFTGLRETIHPLYAACEKGRRKGMIFVAGQKPEFEETYPAIFEPVIGVERGTFGSMFDFHYRPDAAYEVQAWGDGELVTRGGGRQYLYGSEYSAAVVGGSWRCCASATPAPPWSASASFCSGSRYRGEGCRGWPVGGGFGARRRAERMNSPQQRHKVRLRGLGGPVCAASHAAPRPQPGDRRGLGTLRLVWQMPTVDPSVGAKRCREPRVRAAPPSG